MVAGGIFVYYADDTASPLVMQIFGWLMMAVGVGLIILAPARHRAFALWSAAKFKKIFRPAGLASLAFGIYLIWAALLGPEGF